MRATSGDCYAVSYGNTTVIVNNTSHEITVSISDQTLQIPLDQYFTVDVLTPLYVLAHNDRQNMLIDLSKLQSEGLNRDAVRQYSTGKRVREIEWNRVYQALQLRDGLWILNENLCGLFMDLDVSQLMDSFEQALA